MTLLIIKTTILIEWIPFLVIHSLIKQGRSLQARNWISFWLRILMKLQICCLGHLFWSSSPFQHIERWFSKFCQIFCSGFFMFEPRSVTNTTLFWSKRIPLVPNSCHQCICHRHGYSKFASANVYDARVMWCLCQNNWGPLCWFPIFFDRQQVFDLW